MKKLLTLLFLCGAVHANAQLSLTLVSNYLSQNQNWTGTNTFSTWLAGNGGGLTNLPSPNDISVLRSTVSTFDDMFYGGIGTGAAGTGPFGWVSFLSSGTIVAATADSSHPGVLQVKSGASSGNYGAFGNAYNAVSDTILGACTLTNEWCFRLGSTVSTADGSVVRLGLTGVAAPALAEPANGVYLRYNTNNANFQYVCAAASSYTTNDSGLAAAANTWYKLRIVVTDTSSAVFTINDANGWTNSANIPTAALQLQVNTVKAAGATQQAVDVDYCYFGYKLNSAR